MTVESALALFLMLAFSSLALFFAHRIKLPHTVALVALGVLLGFSTLWGPLSFLDDIALTPELLFYIFLPILIFESAFNINIRRLTDDIPVISLLAVVGLLVSSVLIAVLVDAMMGLLGFDIPFILALIFGAIISSTDPVAVLALFKEYGAPRRLSLIFEGESIFNDGTAVALFLIVLAIAESGVVGAESILEGALTFLMMVTGGIVFGLVFGGLFAKVIGYTKSNEFAAITLTMVLAHVTFICAELVSQNVSIGGFHIHVSAIIATAIASLLMGNYGRFKLPPRSLEFLEKYWGQFAFLANSVVFILIGMLAIKLPAAAPDLVVPVLCVIGIVAFSRAVSIYPLLSAYNLFASKESRVPLSWQHTLAWGSLRGALAVTMVLLIPDDLTFPQWSYAFSPKELVLTLTVGCIFATLFIKATTMSSLMRRLKLDVLTPLEEVNYREMLLHINSVTGKKLHESLNKGYLDENIHQKLISERSDKSAVIRRELSALTENPEMLRRVISLHAIGIERKYMWELFKNNEIDEFVARKISAKLEYQSRAIERGDYSDKYDHGAEQDIFEYLANRLKSFSSLWRSADNEVSNYLYYRALSIISRKVYKELPGLAGCFGDDFRLPLTYIEQTVERYARYRDGAKSKQEDLRTTNPELFRSVEESLARRAALKNDIRVLEDLKEREMVTPKVFIALEDRFKEETGHI